MIRIEAVTIKFASMEDRDLAAMVLIHEEEMNGIEEQIASPGTELRIHADSAMSVLFVLQREPNEEGEIE